MAIPTRLSLDPSFHTPGSDFAPRVGIAWIPQFEDHTPRQLRHVLRSHAHQSLVQRAQQRFHQYRHLQPGTDRAGAPAFPSSNVLAGAQHPRCRIYRHLADDQNAYTINTGVQMSRKLSNNDALTVGYVHTGARDSTYLRNMNLINPDQLPGRRTARLLHRRQRHHPAVPAVELHH